MKFRISFQYVRFLTLIAVAFWAVMPSVALAEDEVADMQLADSLYRKGDFTMAADAYYTIAKVDGVSAPLYFNMANAYAQAGDLGHAILYYSRAQRLDPSDKEISNNLHYFASKVEDSNRAELRGKKISVSGDPETFFQTVRRMICSLSVSVWASSAVIAFLIFLAAVAVYLFCSDVTLRKTGFFGGICALLLSIMFIVFAFTGASDFDSHDSAVLMAYKTELLIEPSSDAKPATNQLCQGTRFDIIAEETDVKGEPTWYKVRLNADIEGWVRATDIEVI